MFQLIIQSSVLSNNIGCLLRNSPTNIIGLYWKVIFKIWKHYFYYMNSVLTLLSCHYLAHLCMLVMLAWHSSKMLCVIHHSHPVKSHSYYTKDIKIIFAKKINTVHTIYVVTHYYISFCRKCHQETYLNKESKICYSKALYFTETD